VGRGRRALLATASAYAAALVWSAAVVPARVPIHFDAGGRVDDWASRSSMLALWLVAGVVVLVGVPLVGRLTTSGDGTWINMPQRSKDYWLAPERRAEFRVRFQDDMEVFAAMTGLLLGAGLVLTTWVAVTDRQGAPAWSFPVGIGAYLVLTALWTVRLLARYRPPTAP
jgi:uncharacterized membrane protein